MEKELNKEDDQINKKIDKNSIRKRFYLRKIL